MQAIGKRSVSSFLAALINVGWYVVAITLVLMLCLAVMPLFTDLSNAEMSIPVSFRVDTGALRPIAPAPGIAKADIPDVEGSGTLRFSPPSGTFLTTTALLVAMAMAIGLWVLTQLRAVFRTLRDGRPFVPANAARIRWIAYAVILGEIARSFVLFVGNAYARSHFAADGLSFDRWPSINVFAIIHGLIILVIAEVFRAGTRLDEDQSLTI
jgi:Protein of unknown function (DUF2975)